jgi:hypothetical protein
MSCLPFGYPQPRSTISGLGNGGLQGLARRIGTTIFEGPTSPGALTERRARSPNWVVNRAHQPKVGCHPVAELLGNSSTRITEDVYSHVTARLAEESATALDRAV